MSDIRSDEYGDFYVKTRRRRYGAIDASKKILIPFIYDGMFLSYGSDLVWAKKNNLWGCLNRKGKTMIPFVFSYANAFVNGYAIVSMPNLGCFIINEKGENVLGKTFFFIYRNSDGFLEVNDNGLKGIIDSDLKIIIPPKYASIFGPDQAGMYRVEDPARREHYGYVRHGKLVIPCIYNRVNGFTNGVATIRNFENKWGVIDVNGHTIIPFEYDEMGISMNEGLIAVKKGGKYGYIDIFNNVVIPFKYEIAHDFFNRTAQVKIDEDGPWTCIDRFGNIVGGDMSCGSLRSKRKTALNKMLKKSEAATKEAEWVCSLRGKTVEIKSKFIMGFLIHYAAPFTGSDEIAVPLKTKFLIDSKMRDDAFYCECLNDKINETALKKALEKSDKNPLLAGRCSGISFFVTLSQIKNFCKVQA